MKYLGKNKKTHTFFLKIEVEMMSNNEDFCEEHGGFERGSIGEDNEQSQKFEGKPKCLKIDLFAQNMRFSRLG